ncbi:MAG: chromosome segregation protein SMC [Ruminococcus sp.]|nr:chromosome segregation protein SMC [Ruminococcus sp.]
MYLKSLEIQGFKSFPDKINLTFDKGLTAVVGPNGSGKSNIGDSVRWVLGEQSTKTLRGNKMEDVIFSGTVSRKPMGFASVTLNIDNSDGTLSDMGEEVAVTRKLYRSGESEYRINGKSVRLKDINELFMDTGLGRDGYSIIGQGRIAEIVGAKSNERRDIFEEAAGISKFRYRKIEAEKKLTSAQENLFRLTDILSELENRIEPLRIQSEKAEKFLKFSEEKKKLEVSVWVKRLDDMKKSLEELEEKILVSRTEYENIENDIQEQEKKLEDGYRKMQESTIKSDEIRRKMIEEEQLASEMKSKIAVLENDIKHAENAIISAEKSISGYDDTKKSLDEQKQKIIENIEILENQKSNLENEISETEKNIRNTEQEISRLNDNSGKSGAEINNLYIKQSEKHFSLESAQKIISDETEHLSTLRKNSSEYAEKIFAYTEKKENSGAELEKIRLELSELEKNLDECENLYNSQKNEYAKITGELQKFEYSLREKQQRQKILYEMERNMEGFAGSVKAVLRQNITGVYGTVAQNMNVPQQYAIAIETALGGAMQNIIVADEETAKKCIDFLKIHKSGRATFLPVTAIRGRELNEQGLEKCDGFVAIADKIIECKQNFREIMLSLLGRTVIAENISTATAIAKKYNYRFRIVTMDGQIINSGGAFTGGSVQKISGIITRRNEINTLEKDIESLSGQCEKLRNNAEKIRPENEKISQQIENIKSGITTHKNEIVRLNTEISGIESLSEQIKSQTENNIRLIEEAEKKIHTARAEIENSEKQLAEISEKISVAEKEFAEEKTLRENLNRNMNEFSEKISDLKINYAGTVKDIQAENSGILRITSRHCAISRNLELRS